MKKFIIFVLIILISTPVFAEVLVEFTNPVTIKNTDNTDINPSVGLDIPLGALITTGNAGKAMLMDDMGTFTTIESNKSITLGKQDSNEQQKPQGAIRALAVAMRDATASNDGPTVYGMVKRGTSSSALPRPLNPPPYHGIYPISVSVEKPQIIKFMWNVDQERKNIYIMIEDSKKNIPVKKAVNFKDGSCEIGPKPFLQGEQYSWWIARKENNEFFPLTTKYSFDILNTAKFDQLNQDIQSVEKIVSSEISKNLLLGQLYYSYGFYNKAVEYLVPIYKDSPTDFLGNIILRSYYSQRLPHEADKLGLSNKSANEDKESKPVLQKKPNFRRGK